jgi:hypothetical protein
MESFVAYTRPWRDRRFEKVVSVAGFVVRTMAIGVAALVRCVLKSTGHGINDGLRN